MDATDSKKGQFDRLWNTDHPTKRTRFRNLMRQKLAQIKMPYTEENARSFYLGILKAAPVKEAYEDDRPPFRERRAPPRRGPRRGR
jgi:hypothetical protein